MAISQAQRFQNIIHWGWQVLFIGLIFSYVSVIAILFMVKKMEFTPFEKVKDKYLQVNPFKDQIILDPQPYFKWQRRRGPIEHSV